MKASRVRLFDAQVDSTSNLSSLVQYPHFYSLKPILESFPAGTSRAGQSFHADRKAPGVLLTFGVGFWKQDVGH